MPRILLKLIIKKLNMCVCSSKEPTPSVVQEDIKEETMYGGIIIVITYLNYKTLKHHMFHCRFKYNNFKSF